MSGQWLDREGLITVKTYPNPSKKYHETVCVAAITREEGWVRLYPVRFRSMPPERRFKKYHLIRFRMRASSRDPRPESYRIDEDSVQLVDWIEPSRWQERARWIDPCLSAGMCDIQGMQRLEGKSLGAFRPRVVKDLLVTDGKPDWSSKQKEQMAQQLLFEERLARLEKIPLDFTLEYECESPDCRGHSQMVLDWEIMALYRNVCQTAGSPDERKAKIRAKYLGLFSARRDATLFVGNHHLYPVTFMVLGVFSRPKEPQRTFF